MTSKPHWTRIGLSIALAGAIAIGASRAEAYSVAVTGTMCTKFFTGAYGCGGGSSYVEAQNFDDSLKVYAADSNTATTKLLVFFHGHGLTPLGNTDFLIYAAELGFDVITLDYDYSRDYTQPASPLPSDAACGGGTCAMSIDAVCGCYADCYGYRNADAWIGGGHAGLPTVSSDWSVDTRLNKILNWMVSSSGNSTWQTRFANYLDGAQRGGINWSKVTVAGHSLGSDLAGYIGKWQSVNRVIMMSGPAGKLAPDSGDYVHWGTAFGCSNSSSAGCGSGTSFPGCSCQSTTYTYGAANGIGTCALSSAAIGWVADNNFGTNTGYVWQTSNSHYYAFNDSNDNIANWSAPMTISSHRNWLSINLDARHDSGYSDGWNEVGDYVSPQYLQAGNWHGVVSHGINNSLSQICSSGSGHNATISDSACPGSAPNYPAANRYDVWGFMLTH